MFEAHKIGSCRIDGNPAETTLLQLPILGKKHIDNFASRLSKSNEKYPHLDDTIHTNGFTFSISCIYGFLVYMMERFKNFLMLPDIT